MQINLLINFLEFFIFYIPLKRIFNLTYKPRTLDLIVLFIEVFLINLIPGEYDVLIVILGQLLISSYYIITFISTKKKDISLPILYYSVTIEIVLLIQSAIAIVLGILNVDNSSPFIRILANVLTVAAVYIVYNFTSIIKLYHILTNASVYIRLIMIDIYIILVGIMVNFKIDSSYTYEHLQLFTCVYIIIFIASGGMVYYENKSKIQEQVIESYSASLPLYQSLLDEIRASQHEYDNRIATICSLINTSKNSDETLDNLKAYVSDYSNHSEIYPLITINMPLLAASLYNQYAKAAQRGINVVFSIPNNNLFCIVPEYQLTDFVCILVQNAIEESKPGSYVFVKITNENKVLTVDVRNTSDTFYTKEQLYDILHHDCGKSGKKNKKKDGMKHGYGLYHLIKTLRKYDGILDGECVRFNDENWVVIRMIV